MKQPRNNCIKTNMKYMKDEWLLVKDGFVHL